ncbi:MAG: L-2-hydroxyglutarate oxidase, partial [Chloroflexi bacterium]|nr:L-2-hydroxyglutarate oxidase [Chloroflexota bacterium]
MKNGIVFDFAIIGGGLLGLATAWALKAKYSDTSIVLIEKENNVAMHQSGRNSGVLHSGIYYKPGSLKSQLTAKGRAKLLDFCNQHGVPYEICGKLILATRENEIEKLEALYKRGVENELKIKYVDPKEISEIEPHAAGLKGIWIPETGIVDFVRVARNLATRVSALGVEIRLGATLLDFKHAGRDLKLVTSQGNFRTRVAVNCSGLFSDRLARKTGIKPRLRIVPFRGEYFKLTPEARHLVRGLIYPLADPRLPFLGVHLTKTADGEVLAGPNAVLALKREGYHARDFELRDAVDSIGYSGFWKLILANIGLGLGELLKAGSVSAFTRATQKLVPEIRVDDFVPTRAGVRAQAVDINGKI